jgi:capsular polysaccharide biosynthesis protein
MSPLVFLECSSRKGVVGKYYLEQVLEPIVTPTFLNMLDYKASSGSEYVEDGALIHGQKGLLVETKVQLGIPVHKRPASSPDLNPIQNVWRTMKRRIKAREDFPETMAKMRVAVQAEWDRLELKDWNKFIDSML